MKLVEHYSHLNGLEFLKVHRPQLWEEVVEVIAGVVADACRTKESKEKRSAGKLLYSPVELNKKFREAFGARGWTEHNNTFWVTSDARLMRTIYNLSASDQKEAIEAAGHEPLMSYNQTDFLKERVALEVQFGKYAFVAHDLFVKHLSFYVADIIDVGIEILPMKSLEREMSSGVPYYERDLMNLIRQGRGVPAVPLVLIGVAP